MRAPERVRLEGRRVLLRPFRRNEAKAFWEANEDFEESFGPPRPYTKDRVRRIVDRSGRLYRGRIDLAIEARGRLVGEIQARTRPSQGLPPGVFELGIVIWNRRDRRHGYGTEATFLLTRWLLDTGTAIRVQLSTDAKNIAMRNVAGKLGFRFEGVLRSFFPSNGGRVDYALYAVVSPDELEEAR